MFDSNLGLHVARRGGTIKRRALFALQQAPAAAAFIAP